MCHIYKRLADKSKKVDTATVKEKLKKPCYANGLLHCAFFNRHSHTREKPLLGNAKM